MFVSTRKNSIFEKLADIKPAYGVDTELSAGKIFYRVYKCHPMIGFQLIEHFEKKEDAEREARRLNERR